MKKIKKLKTGLFSRNLALAKLASKVGKDLYFSKKDELVGKLKDGLGGHVDLLSKELGEMKGSFLKAGQMLSLYAGDLLPPKLNDVLQSMQSETSYLEWEEIKKQVPSHIIEGLDIEEEAFAAASIGQVHRAKDKDGNVYALKIQYKNVEKLIDSDLRILKAIVNISKVAPKGMKLTDAFDEIREMLFQEMDYHKEAEYIEKFREFKHKDYDIPNVNLEFSTKNVLCLDYIDAKPLDEALKDLSIEDKTRLGEEFFRLFLYEIFIWKLTQSDAHFGNFLIRDGRWVLIDFGASKEVSERMSKIYFKILKGLIELDKEAVFASMIEYGAINSEKSDMDIWWDYCELIAGPLQNIEYEWESSDVAKVAMNKAREMYKNTSFHFMPHESMFIDRKIAGVFYMLKKVGVKLNLNKVFYDFVKEHDL